MADGGIKLIARDPADVSTPPSGKVTIFPDSTNSDTPSFKDSSGTTTSFAGGTGPTGPGYGGTSTTSLAIGTGSKAFTTQAGLAYVAGSRVRAASGADPDTDWMEGVVSSYVTTTLTILMDLTSGAGTHTDWSFTLAGEPPGRWLGAWDSGTAYIEGDAVGNDGGSYICILANTNQEPPDGTYWDVLAAPGVDATIDWGETGDIVDQDFDDVADAGVLDEVARADHRHGMPADPGGGAGGITRSQAGTTSIGGNFDNTLKTVAKKVTLASAGFVGSINIAIKGDNSNTANLTGFILDDAAGTPGKIVAAGGHGPQRTSGSSIVSAIFVNTTARFIAIPIGVWLAAGDYWLCVVSDGTSGNGSQIAYASGSGSDRTSAATDAARDNSITSLTAGTDDYSIYADILR